jgi:thymidylate synthase (FAD)
MAEIKVDYIDHMGNDLTVVNAARVSFDKESTDVTHNDDKLITYLATHGHWTPFSHPQITVRESVPIFIARQRFKHMVGFTYNEVSRRYVDDTPEFYQPKAWRGKPAGSIKQGSTGAVELPYALRTQASHHWNDEALHLYNSLLEHGVAPEQARMVLPQSMMTSYYVTGSLAAFARMFNQRTDSHAQVEIQELARHVSEIIEPLFPISWAALVDEV